MSEEDSESVEESSSPTAMFQSPTLNHLLTHHSKLLPTQDFACQHCPNAIWFIQNQQMLVCFCQVMKLVSWSTRENNLIAMCDGMWVGSEED